MEHSLYAYLEKQSSARLEQLLRDIRSGKILGNCTYIIPIVEKILIDRNR